MLDPMPYAFMEMLRLFLCEFPAKLTIDDEVEAVTLRADRRRSSVLRTGSGGAGIGASYYGKGGSFLRDIGLEGPEGGIDDTKVSTHFGGMLPSSTPRASVRDVLRMRRRPLPPSSSATDLKATTTSAHLKHSAASVHSLLQSRPSFSALARSVMESVDVEKEWNERGGGGGGGVGGGASRYHNNDVSLDNLAQPRYPTPYVTPLGLHNGDRLDWTPRSPTPSVPGTREYPYLGLQKEASAQHLHVDDPRDGNYPPPLYRSPSSRQSTPFQSPYPTPFQSPSVGGGGGEYGLTQQQPAPPPRRLDISHYPPLSARSSDFDAARWKHNQSSSARSESGFYYGDQSVLRQNRIGHASTQSIGSVSFRQKGGTSAKRNARTKEMSPFHIQHGRVGMEEADLNASLTVGLNSSSVQLLNQGRSGPRKGEETKRRLQPRHQVVLEQGGIVNDAGAALLQLDQTGVDYVDDYVAHSLHTTSRVFSQMLQEDQEVRDRSPNEETLLELSVGITRMQAQLWMHLGEVIHSLTEGDFGASRLTHHSRFHHVGDSLSDHLVQFQDFPARLEGLSFFISDWSGLFFPISDWSLLSYF
jgi:hypothetical protein